MKRKKVRCPKCGKMAGEETPKRWWMYLIPLSKNYYCLECYHEFMIGNIATALHPAKINPKIFAIPLPSLL